MIYKGNKLLYVLFLILTNILNVSESTITLYRHNDDSYEHFDSTPIYSITDAYEDFDSTPGYRPTYNKDAYEDFDITTIYRITNISSFESSNGTFNGMNSVIEIHSRNNAIGMPIQDNDNDIHIISTNIKEIINLGTFQNNSRMSTSYNSNDWFRQTIDLDGFRGCSRNEYRKMDSGNRLNKCYNAYEYDSFRNRFSDIYTGYDSPVICDFFTFYWTPDNDDQTCLTMTYFTKYYKPKYDGFSITIDINDEYNNMLISSTVLDKYNGITTLKINNIDFKNNQEYRFSLKLTLSEGCTLAMVDQGLSFGLIRIGQSSNYGKNIQNRQNQKYLFRFKINDNGYRFLVT
ncbi:uncharacterized protein LOC100572974 isoform X2 [Acyrthosiphon pisum]|uniref:Uncharacterized protein n=1 Tax=Acyrthosiphon pisum TaxID=7029 RepID=A0A8R2JS28_ACYPI|nr:uncharacterized protein LOC100572974 isoform X2 [Acyrthosiphon pisum]